MRLAAEPKRSDESDSARVGFATFQSRLLDQKCGNNPVDHLQHGREQLRIGGEEGAQRDRNQQHPLAHRHSRDNATRPGGRRFPPCAASRKRGKPASLAGEGYRFSWAHSAQRNRKNPCARMPHSRKASNPSLTNSGKPAQSQPRLERKSSRRACLNQLIQGGFFRAPSLVVDGLCSRRALERMGHDLFVLWSCHTKQQRFFSMDCQSTAQSGSRRMSATGIGERPLPPLAE